MTALLKLHVLAPLPSVTGNGDELHPIATFALDATPVLQQICPTDGSTAKIASWDLQRGAHLLHELRAGESENVLLTAVQRQYTDRLGRRLKWTTASEFAKVTLGRRVGTAIWLHAAIAYLKQIDPETALVLDWQQ